MLKDRLSVVIPYYNDLLGLKRLLETMPVNDVDVIVVDDNSDQNKSAFILKKIYPCVRFYQNNSEISNAGSARNLGLTKVETMYVMFADSDDFFCEGAFEKIEQLLMENFDCAYFLTDAKSEVNNGEPDRNVFYNDLIYDFIAGNESIRYEFVVPWSKIINMSLINNNNISFDEVSVSNDMYFSLLVGIHSKVILTPKEYAYCVVKNGTGISTNLSQDKSRCRLGVNIRCNQLLMAHGVNYKHFFSTKSVLLRSNLSMFKLSDRLLFLKYTRYVMSIAFYRIKFKC